MEERSQIVESTSAQRDQRKNKGAYDQNRSQKQKKPTQRPSPSKQNRASRQKRSVSASQQKDRRRARTRDDKQREHEANTLADQNEITNSSVFKFFSKDVTSSSFRDETIRRSFIDHRRPKVLALLTGLLVLKIAIACKLIQIFTKDPTEYRDKYPELWEKYPAEETVDTSSASSDKSFLQDVEKCLIQESLIIFWLSLALYLAYKTYWLSLVLKCVVGVAQIFELPFWPVLPNYYFLMLAITNFANIYLLSIISCTSLLQAVPLNLFLMMNIIVRLHMRFDQEPDWLALPVFYGLCFIMAMLMTLDTTLTYKLTFVQRFEITKQRNDFSAILGSFPEGVLIARIRSVRLMQPKQNANISDQDCTCQAIIDGSAPEGSCVLHGYGNEYIDHKNQEVQREEVIVPNVRFINHQLRQVLNVKQLGIKKALEQNLFQPYIFKTSQTNKDLLKTSEATVTSSRNKSQSLAQMLVEGWVGKRFYHLAKSQEDLDAPNQEDGEDHSEQKMVLEIQIKPRRFDNYDCHLIVIRNVSYVMRQEKAQSEFEYQQLMIQTMSHEQLTPLNAIINLSETLRAQENGEVQLDKKKSSEYMEIIWSSAKLLEYQVQSQISQLKVHNSTLQLNYEIVSRASLKTYVENVVKPFNIPMMSDNLTCEIVILSQMPLEVITDMQIFEQILYNIFYNAVKFNQTGGQIVVTLEYDHENHLLLTTVKDTGIGIPSKKQQLLFQAFKANQQDDEDINYVDSTSGIGVGLSNSKILVESMGGNINLQSEVGMGTTVIFSIDASASADPQFQNDKTEQRRPAMQLYNGMIDFANLGETQRNGGEGRGGRLNSDISQKSLHNIQQRQAQQTDDTSQRGDHVKRSLLRSNSNISDISRPNTQGDLNAPGKRNPVYIRQSNIAATTNTFGDDLNFDSVFEICNQQLADMKKQRNQKSFLPPISDPQSKPNVSAKYSAVVDGDPQDGPTYGTSPEKVKKGWKPVQEMPLNFFSNKVQESSDFSCDDEDE